jgi:carboxyl-terminal processing protease
MTRTSLLLLAATASIFSAFSGARAETNFGQVAMHVAYMLQNHHYSHKDFDDDASKRLLENYLNLLDFKHVFFTQQDVDGFRKMYDTTLDDHVLMRNISPAIEIYDIYKQRVSERVAFAKKALETNKFTFDSDRTLTIKRDKLPWPKDKAASDKLWLDLIEDNLIQERLIDKNRVAEEKKKAAEKAEKDKNAKADPKAEAKKAEVAEAKKTAKADEDDESKLPPAQRVAKDYERLLESVEENSDTEEVVNFFLSCLASTYDPHTEYMSHTEINNFNIQMKHSLVGIGALLGKKDDGVEIQGIVVGGPADKQGELQLDDKIISVAQGENGEFVDVRYKRKLQDIVDMIRGEVDTTVRLKIVPADDPSSTKVIAIKRAEVELKDKVASAELIETPSAIGKPLKIGWIQLPSFYADMEEGKVSTTVDCERLLRRLMKEGMEGLVFDLRGNGGGSLEEAIKLTGLFIPAGPVVQAKDWRESISNRSSDADRPVYDGPLIVLTDKASASASEIFAAALQDYNRALIVGDKSTFGKGTVQTILPVERYMPFFADKSRAGALKVTIQKFYRIAGGSTQLRGVVPDLILPSLRDVMEIGESSAENPLPYDTIPAMKYNVWRKDGFPIEQLKSRLDSRIASNPEFQMIIDESRLLKERIDRNTISLSESGREKEREGNETRRKKQEAERAERVKQVAATLKDGGFKIYHLTLDNVDKPGLVLESDITREQTTGMRTAKGAKMDDEDEGDHSVGSKFPYGLEPVKLESMHIMRDLIDLTKMQPTTAKTGEKTKASAN